MVYPHTITRPVNKYKIDYKQYLKDFIHDLRENRCRITCFVGDNPKRALAKYVLSHSSLFPCEYCFSRGTSYSIGEQQQENKKRDIQKQITVLSEKIDSLNEEDVDEIQTLTAVKECLISNLKEASKKKTKVVWPFSSRDGEARTKEKIMSIVNALETDTLSKEDAKGIVGRSPLLDIDYFDFTLDNPAEYLHSVCLGVGKRLVELTFNVGISRPRITKRKLTCPSVLSKLICNIKVVSEFSRRARALDFAVWKAQEYRNLILFMYPLIIDSLEKSAKERKLWLWFAYMIRACILPTQEFQLSHMEEIEYCCAQFYKLYEELFGPQNCTYNTHVVLSHLLKIRNHGPLTMTSAFGFEHFYGEIRRSFTPGTVSPLKQIMQKIYISRTLTKHRCNPQIIFKKKETALECDTLIYTYNHQMYKFFQIVDIHENDLTCVKIRTSPSVRYKETPTLKWERVGHFKLEEITDEIVRIKPETIAGKAIKINECLITCPINVLDEK